MYRKTINNSNVILLNSEHTVIDSLRHLNKFDNSNRDIFPGSKYLNIESDKKDFLSVKTFDEFYKDVSIDVENLPATLSKVYNGFGKKNISYLLETLNITTAVSTNNLKGVYSYLKDLFTNMPDNVVLKEYSSVKKDYFAYKSTNDGLSVNFFLDDFYTSKEQSEQFKQYRDTVLKLVLNHVGKIKERISTIDSKIADCTNAAKTDGQILYYVSKELRDDYDVVLEAVKNKGLIIKYASKRLRSDKTIAIEAIKNDKRAYDFIVPELRQDEEIQAIINPPA